MSWDMVDFSNPLAVKLRKQTVEAIARYKMINEGDRLMVCVSGGKDSAVLLALLTEIQRRAPYQYEIEAVMLDQGHPGFDSKPFEAWVKSLGVKMTVIAKDTYSIVKEKVTSGVYCSMCSRLRRGILYDFAAENRFTHLVLGHHREDLCETLLMNLFYTGKTASMPPKLRSDDRRNRIIRPLVLCAEEDLAELSRNWQIPIIPCNLCGSQENLKRKKMKNWLSQLEKEIPLVKNSILGALGNIHLSQMMDQSLWDFDLLDQSEVTSISEDQRSIELGF